MTAAAFTKGLLDLEGNLASILVQLVKRDQNATNMLDTSNDATEGLSKYCIIKAYIIVNIYIIELNRHFINTFKAVKISIKTLYIRLFFICTGNVYELF